MNRKLTEKELKQLEKLENELEKSEEIIFDDSSIRFDFRDESE